jgi:predicted outer membrane repeat protein
LGNKALKSGGAIYFDTSVYMNANYLNFTTNQAEFSGGAISFNGNDTTDLRDCYFFNNTS